MARNTDKLAKVIAFVANHDLEKVERYAKAGRRFSASETAALKAEWAEAYRTWASNPTNDDLAREHEDREAELNLRDEDPPFDDVESAMEELTESVAQTVAAISKNPAMYRKLAALIEDDMRAFEIDVVKARKN